MKDKKIRLIGKILILYFLIAIIFRYVGGEQLDFKYVVSEMPQPTGIVEELAEGKTVVQSFTVETETLDTIDVKFMTYGRENSGMIRLQLFDENENIVAEYQDDVKLLTDDENYKWVIRPGIPNAEGRNYRLQITSTCEPGKAPSVYFASTENSEYEVNGEAREGELCIDYVGKTFFCLEPIIGFWLLLGQQL